MKIIDQQDAVAPGTRVRCIQDDKPAVVGDEGVISHCFVHSYFLKVELKDGLIHTMQKRRWVSIEDEAIPLEQVLVHMLHRGEVADAVLDTLQENGITRLSCVHYTGLIGKDAYADVVVEPDPGERVRALLRARFANGGGGINAGKRFVEQNYTVETVQQVKVTYKGVLNERS